MKYSNLFVIAIVVGTLAATPAIAGPVATIAVEVMPIGNIPVSVIAAGYGHSGVSPLAQAQVQGLASAISPDRLAVPVMGLSAGGLAQGRVVVLPKSIAALRQGVAVAITSRQGSENPKVLTLSKSLAEQVRSLLKVHGDVEAFHLLAARFDNARPGDKSVKELDIRDVMDGADIPPASDWALDAVTAHPPKPDFRTYVDQDVPSTHASIFIEAVKRNPAEVKRFLKSTGQSLSKKWSLNVWQSTSYHDGTINYVVSGHPASVDLRTGALRFQTR